MHSDINFNELKVLYFAALELDPGDHEAFIEKKCSDNREMRDLLFELLEQHYRPTNLFDRPAWKLLEDEGTSKTDDCKKQEPGMHVSPNSSDTSNNVMDNSSNTDNETHSSDNLGVIGDFKIIREIGKGGMGTVYEAEQISLNRRVALKVLPLGFSISTNIRERHLREAKALARLHHPGIVTIFTTGTDRDNYYIAQELVEDGYTISHEIYKLKNGKKLPPGYFRKIASLIASVADALQHAHDHGVIHRDVKPLNILLTKKGQPKVTDFGLAKVQDFDTITQTGALAGSIPYMSPEQTETQKFRIDHRTDIYSLGVTLYEMLTLKRPFEGTISEILKKIGSTAPIEPLKSNPSVPRDLSTICLNAMENLPDKRYQHMDDFADDLRRFLSGDAISVNPASITSLVWKRIKRNPVASTAIGVALNEDLKQVDDNLYDSLTEKHDKAILGDLAPPKDTGPLKKYLDALESDCNRDLLSPLFPDAGLRLLENVYVELKAMEHDPKLQREGACCLDDMASRAGRLGERGKSLREYLEFRNTRCWTLQGDPGSGKTTLLLHLAHTLCREAKEAIEKPDGRVSFIPVFVSINDWYMNQTGIWEYLSACLTSSDPIDVRAVLSSELASGHVLWLLDGFDEVDSNKAEFVSRKIQRLAEEVAPCPVVMTSRRFGYRKPGEDFTELEPLPLTAVAQQELLERFLEQAHAKGVLNRIQQHRSMQDLVCNPFLLTMIGLVASQSKGEGLFEKTPLRRSQLLSEVELLLLNGKPGRVRTPMPDLELSRMVLEDLSLKLLSDGGGPYSVLRISELLLTDNRASRLRREWPGGGIDTNTWLSEVANRTGLLLPHGRNHDRWRYLHRSIQEHMAARCLNRLGRDQWAPLAESLKKRDADKTKDDRSRLGQWAETFAYLAGEVSDPNALLKDLMMVNADLGLRALATADCVAPETMEKLLKLTSGGKRWKKRKTVIESIPDKLGATEAGVRLLAKIRGGTMHGADLYFISKAYRAIADKTGDPDVERLALKHDHKLFEERLSKLSRDELDEIVATLRKVSIDGRKVDLWCTIPEGKFLMGSPKDEEGRYDWEPTNHFVRLSAFKMSAVPVTNAMYEYFDSSHEPDRAFRNKIPAGERIEDHPVVNVTWYEAVMYCRWATEVLRLWGVLKAWQTVRLPSESEWEYVCRAGTKTRFWSGDKDEDLADVGWYSKNAGDRTHPVGMKPSNAWGLHDVHGNVWEWCQDDWHGSYDGAPTDGSAWSGDGRYCVHRGGGWASSRARLCRCASRNHWEPGLRDGTLGFRLVLAARDNREGGPFS